MQKYQPYHSWAFEPTFKFLIMGKKYSPTSLGYWGQFSVTCSQTLSKLINFRTGKQIQPSTPLRWQLRHCTSVNLGQLSIETSKDTKLNGPASKEKHNDQVTAHYYQRLKNRFYIRQNSITLDWNTAFSSARIILSDWNTTSLSSHTTLKSVSELVISQLSYKFLLLFRINSRKWKLIASFFQLWALTREQMSGIKRT